MNAPFVTDGVNTDLLRIGSDVIRRAAAAQYTDAVNGDDGNDGLTWGTAKKTCEAAWDELPSRGRMNHYVRGYSADKLEPSRTYWPHDDFQGHLRIHGCDPWTVVATGTITAHSSMTGRLATDEFTIAWDGGYVAADDPDRRYWLEFEDDTAATFLRKLFGFNSSTGNYESWNQWTFPTITGPVSVRLVRPTTQIHPTAFQRVGSADATFLGSVAMQGVDFKPSGFNGSWGLGLSACYVDATGHYRAFSLHDDGVLGGHILAGSGGVAAGFQYVYFYASDLVGTPLEGKTAGFYMPGSHLQMDGSSSALCTLTGGPLGNRIFWSTFEGGRVEVWNGTSVIPGYFRGIGERSHIYAATRSNISLSSCKIDGRVQLTEDAVCRVGNTIYLGGVDIVEGFMGSSGAGIDTVVIERDAPADEKVVSCERSGRLDFIRFEGGFDLATPGSPLPAVDIAGSTTTVDLDLDNMDRGDGPMTLIREGAKAELLECKGDNTNAGGSGDCVGLKIEDPSFVTVDVSEATATGADGDVKVGSLAAQAWPGAGTRVNDISNPPAATDHLAQLKTT